MTSQNCVFAAKQMVTESKTESYAQSGLVDTIRDNSTYQAVTGMCVYRYNFNMFYIGILLSQKKQD